MDKLIALTLILFTTLSAHAQSQSIMTDIDIIDINMIDELLLVQEDVNLALAPIKTKSDFDKYIKKIPKDSPINLLPGRDRMLFLSSLRFSDKGLASFDYQTLVDNLNVTEAFMVLSLFGQQHLVAKIGGLKIQSNVDKDILFINGATSRVRSKFFNNEDVFDGDFLKGYRCAAPGSCESHSRYACTKNC